MSSHDIFELSKLARGDKQPKAVAHHNYVHIQEIDLALEADDIPLRHANIINWPKEKFEQMDCSEKLASKANLERYDSAN